MPSEGIFRIDMAGLQRALAEKTGVYPTEADLAAMLGTERYVINGLFDGTYTFISAAVLGGIAQLATEMGKSFCDFYYVEKKRD